MKPRQDSGEPAKKTRLRAEDIDSAPTELRGIDDAPTQAPRLDAPDTRDPITLARTGNGSVDTAATAAAPSGAGTRPSQVRGELPAWAIELGRTVEGLKESQEVFGGRYTLVRRIGRGGMGVVWQARDNSLNRDVALKFLPEALMEDRKAVTGLMKETKNALELTYPHVVRIYDFVTDGTMAGISMEYVDGLSLAKRAVEQPEGVFEVEQLREWVGQLCEALDYAHNRAKVIHRDLKPANLMVNSKGELKLADFGISARLGRTRTALSSTVVGAGGPSSGTPQYMSPQQMMGDDPAPTDDLYALGATLYDLLTGEPPFYEGEIFQQVRSKTPPSLAERRAKFGVGAKPIPPEWEATIAACLAKEPGQRPQGAKEVAQRLEKSGNREIGKSRNADLGSTVAGGGALGSSKTKFSGKLIAGIAAVATLSFAGWWYVGSYLPAKRIADAELVKQQTAQVERAGKSGNREIGKSGNAEAGSTVAGRVEAGPNAEQARIAEENRVAEAKQAGKSGNREIGKSGNTDHGSTVAGGGEPGGIGVARASEPKEFIVTVDPADAGAQLWLGSAASGMDFAKGRAVVKDLPDGEHELTVVAPGYQTYITRVSVVKNQGLAEVKLVPVRGALAVRARSGTVVTAIDAKGRATRLGTVPAAGLLESANLLNIGSYNLSLEHPDCEPARLESFELRVGKTANLSVTQNPLPGELRIFSVPGGAQLTLDGRAVGKTPATLKLLASETEHRLEASLRGHRSVSANFTLKPKELRTLNLGTLIAESGGIELRGGLPAGTTVKLDGRETPLERSSAGLRVDGLELGQHTVQVQHPDYETWSGSVSVADEQISPLSPDLKPKPGRVSLRVSGPERLEVSVNGGTATLDGNDIVLPAQEAQTVELKAQGYKTISRSFRLSANARETLNVAMEKQPGPVAGQSYENSLGMKFAAVSGTQVLFSVWETRVKDYEAFASATQREWAKPDFAQGPTHPAVNVSWNDAKAFCDWLTKRERAAGRISSSQEYRLPTDAEWSTAVGLQEDPSGIPQSKDAKIRDVYPWGTQWPPPRGAGNFADEAAKRGRHSNWSIISGYDDGYEDTAPAGSFTPNRFGLYDMSGNVWEWCEDYYNGSSGSRVLRGGSFSDRGVSGFLLSSSRNGLGPGGRGDRYGFRCVLVASVP